MLNNGYNLRQVQSESNPDNQGITFLALFFYSNRCLLSVQRLSIISSDHWLIIYIALRPIQIARLLRYSCFDLIALLASFWFYQMTDLCGTLTL